MIQKIKDFFSKYYFIISAGALAIMYFIIDRQGRSIRQLNQEAQIDKLGRKLDGLRVKADESDEKLKKSIGSYNDLKRQHPDLFAKLGIGCGTSDQKSVKKTDSE